MRCPECRREVDKRDQICPWCGRELPDRRGIRPAIIIAVLFGIFCIAAVILSVILFSKTSAANNLRSRLEEGNKFLEEGNYEMAEVAFEEALKIDEKSVEARVLLAEVYTESAPEGTTDQEIREKQEKQKRAEELLAEAGEQAEESPAGVPQKTYEVYEELTRIYQIQPSPNIYVVNVTVNEVTNVTITEYHTFIEQFLIENNVIQVPQDPEAYTEDPEPYTEDPDLYRGLLLYLPFDGDVEDHSGSNTVITAQGDSVVYAEGVSGEALMLDGDGEYLEAGRGFGLSGDFTFSVWVNPGEDNGNRTDAALFAKYETDHYGPYDFFLSNNKPAAWISDGNGGHKEVISETELPAEIWSHLTFVYHRESESLVIYVDGEYDCEFGELVLTDNDDLVTVGRQALMFKPYEDLQYSGYLDELMLWDRALDEEEIAGLFDGDSYITGEESDEETDEDPVLWTPWTSFDSPGEESREDHILYSSNIGSRNGIVYADFLLEGGPGVHNVAATSGGEVRELGIRPAAGDYICSFVFYKDKLIYACKDAGTDGYHSAIYIAEADGENPELIAEGINIYTEFYIQDGQVVYDYRQMDQDGTYMGTAYDLENGTFSRTVSVLQSEDGGWPVRKEEFYWEGYLYYLDKGNVYRYQPGEAGDEPEFWLSLGNYSVYHLQGIEEGSLFFSAFYDSYGILMEADMETGEIKEISRHTAAGGGDAYFCW